MKLCRFNDCKAGDHKYSVVCRDCPRTRCPERCKDETCDGCMWLVEVEDDKRRESSISE